MLGVGFFFIINVLLLLMVISKIDALDPKDVLKIFIPVSIVYIIFANIGFVKVLVLTFTLTLVILFSVTTKYFLGLKNQVARWVLLGAISMTLSSIFAGTIHLVKAHFIFSTLKIKFLLFFIVLLQSFSSFRR